MSKSVNLDYDGVPSGHRVIWKESLDVLPMQVRLIPRNSKILHVAAQDDKIVIWFSCYSNHPKVARTFYVVGTGDAVPVGDYLGTALLYGGKLVFHVFE